MSRRNRYVVRIAYADGTPGLSFRPTIAAALAVANAPKHGGRDIATAEVLERLASGAEVPTGRTALLTRYRIELATSHDPADRRVRLVTAPTEQAARRIALQRETARLRRLHGWPRSPPKADLERLQRVIRTGRSAQWRLDKVMDALGRGPSDSMRRDRRREERFDEKIVDEVERQFVSQLLDEREGLTA